jgi:metallo-beta-lactamase family protein
MPSVRSSAEPTVTFWGAARSVTGSMHLVQACGRSVLLDCGLVHGADAQGRNREFPFRPKDIDAVLLSHAHLDHCGNLPNLVRQGFAGPIYCTPATRALAAVILGDSAKIQEQETDREVEPLYTGRDVYRTLIRFEAIPYGTPFAVAPGLEAEFVDAGHLLGSAMISLRIDGPAGERRVTFTGDLGRPGLPILRDPAPVPPADLLISESTYGGRAHGPVEDAAERLGEVARRTADRGGRLLIPAFGVGRTQTVVYHLHQLTRGRRIPDRTGSWPGRRRSSRTGRSVRCRGRPGAPGTRQPAARERLSAAGMNRGSRSGTAQRPGTRRRHTSPPDRCRRRTRRTGGD